MKQLIEVKLLKIPCECGATNYQPIEDTRLILAEDEERRCYACGKVISRDFILEIFARFLEGLRRGLTQ